jgi:glucose/arabinose dehydrogenase
VINTLNTPWELVWGPDNYIWVTERFGRISRVHPETGEQQILITPSDVRQNGEGGMLGMVLHPDFNRNPFVYVVYNYDSPNGYREKLVRYRYENNTLSAATTLLENIPASSIHNGSRLLFTRDNKLLMTTGDAANTSLSQNLSSLAGKLLRINLDGTIPSDNPIPNSYIYTYGHRNAQGLAYHPSGRIYLSEHGPAADDEFNQVIPNRNYGWPNVVGAISSSAETDFAMGKNIVEPVLAWTPTIATCDLEWYGNVAIPQWRNTFLLTTLKDQRLIALTLNEAGTAVVKEETFFNGRFGRLRAVLPSPDGRVFLANNLSGNSSQIIEIKAKRP